jgi:glyoxylase-like metal-dependent hydrolase (beta-lactamase superfamily II)
MANEIIPINMDFVNAYIVKTGSDFILVDTGLIFTRAALDEALEKEGCMPGKLKLIIMTHGDIDHSGNAAYLKQKFSVMTAIGKYDAPMVETGKMLMKRKTTSFMMNVTHFFMAYSGKFKKMIDDFEKFKPDMLLEDGFSLADYGVDAKIIVVPGHTPGSIGVLMGNGDFIAGDTFNNRKKPAIAVIRHNEIQLKESIEKLKKVGIKTVYPGHGKPFQASELFK